MLADWEEGEFQDWVRDANGRERSVSSACRIARGLSAAPAHVGENTGQSEWYTPPEHIAAARAVMGGIDLDPASSSTANEMVSATKFYGTKQDGLSKPWRGRVWMNPPYSQPLIAEFCGKLVAEFETGNVSAATVLVNNATETQWFQRLASAASATCFPVGRVRFWAPGRSSAAPLQGQAVIYLGEDCARFCHEFRTFGCLCTWGVKR